MKPLVYFRAAIQEEPHHIDATIGNVFSFYARGNQRRMPQIIDEVDACTEIKENGRNFKVIMVNREKKRSGGAGSGTAINRSAAFE